MITLESGGAELSGTVLDATGGPVIGALVTVQPAAAERPAPFEKDDAASALLAAATVSDSSGAFRLPVPLVPLVLSAQADGYSRGSLRLLPPFREVTLVLVPGSEIVGNVRTAEANKPAANVSVVAVSKSTLSSEPSRVETGMDGEFSLRGLAAGAYEVTASSSNFRSPPALVSVGIGERSEPVNLLVESAFTLSGTVFVDAEHCRRGSLVAAGPGSSSSPIVDGQVTSAGLLGGDYDIAIECDGAVPLQQSIEIRSDDTHRIWTLTRGLSVQGRVESAMGEALAGANVGVYAVNSTGRGSLCVSDAAGEFSCGGLSPGEYRCSLSDGYGQQADAVNVTLSEDTPARVLLRARPAAAIRGRFEGDPSSAVRIYAREEHGSVVEAVVEASHFEFKGLALGRYVVSSTRPQQRRGGEDVAVTLERDGQIVDIQLRAPRWANIRGRVVDERAAPVMDAWVHAELPMDLGGDAFEDSPAVLTDEQGNFTLERLVSGKYDIVVSAGSGEATVRGVESGSADVLVKTTAYGTLSGVVSSSSGAPVTSFELWYQTGAQRNRERYHTDDGSWSLQWLPPGEYRVGAHSELGDAVADVVLDPGRKATVSLTVAPSQ